MGSAALVATHQTVLLTGPGSRASSQLFPTISAAPEATVGAWRPIPIGDEDNALVVGAGMTARVYCQTAGFVRLRDGPSLSLLVGICVVGDTFCCSLDRVGM